jgi:hypothetical protein
MDLLAVSAEDLELEAVGPSRARGCLEINDQNDTKLKIKHKRRWRGGSGSRILSLLTLNLCGCSRFIRLPLRF